MSTNKPSIGAVVLEKAPWVLEKHWLSLFLTQIFIRHVKHPGWSFSVEELKFNKLKIAQNEHGYLHEPLDRYYACLYLSERIFQAGSK